MEVEEHLEEFAKRVGRQFAQRDVLFERISKNIKSWPANITYNSAGFLTEVIYNKDSLLVTKSLTYNSEGFLDSITLEGYSLNEPITKNLIYSEERLTGYTYT